ncbi:hypothetical protein D0Y65_035785, partial [Glycine soja]
FIPILTRVSAFLISQEHTLSARTRFSLFQLLIFGFSGVKMFHALFYSNFQVKIAVEVNKRKKRSAVRRFFKKDMADLLGSSLDYNAYGR